MLKKSTSRTQKQLVAENEDLRGRLDEAEETLRAIRSGEVDALVVSDGGGEQLFTLKGADHPYRMLIEDMSEGALTLTAEGVILYANRSFAEMLKAPLETVIGSTIHTWVAPDGQRILQSLLRKGVDEKRREQLVLTAGDGTLVPVYLSVSNLLINEMPDSFCLVATDLTEQKRSDAIVASEKLARELLAASNQSRLELLRMIEDQKRAEKEREKLEAQLLQAQKMESVGRLAGGVAHDFNNMLSVILGNTEMALDQVDPAQPLHAELQDILTAARRSRDITHKLLAFARMQAVAPKVLGLNETVEGMLKMLRQLIGEDIDLAWRPKAGLWPVKMDPSQIDQILVNLCINARDAIALPAPQSEAPRQAGEVGKVTIETDKVTFDEAYCADHAGFVPGEFALLAVSDSGRGMNKEIIDNIFEPFFTTKGMGRGTGLGLATVYGIVKQNNGFINVYSEPGKGTAVKIYLPRHAGEAEEIGAEGAREILKGRGETMLLVEDDPAIMKMGKMMLKKLGYQVLAASTPGEAMSLAEEHAGGIHLLITDVVMPEMNGRDLAERLHTLYPDLKVLFMSGYTADVIAHQGVLDKGVHFMQKPFSMKDLARKAREALEP